jgi:hypothetical protein
MIPEQADGARVFDIFELIEEVGQGANAAVVRAREREGFL